MSLRTLCFLSAVSDNIPLQSVPHELTQDERDAILSYLNSLGAVRGEKKRSFGLSLRSRPPLFIKRSDDILFEASTQHFFYLRAIVDGSAPRIPKIFNAFSSVNGDFLVMENIDAPTLENCGVSEEQAVEHAVYAVKWLLAQLPSIPDGLFGRISSEAAPVWHPFFKDHRAPRDFANRNELAKYILKVRISYLTIFMARY